MFNGFFSSAHFHHIFGCSVIFFLLFFNNHCLPMVILNNSVSVFKWKQLSYWPWVALFTFLPNTVFIVHVTYMVSFHVQSAFDIFWWSIALYAMLWLCFKELPKPYQHFHSIHTHRLLQIVCLLESPTAVITQIICFLWTSEMSSSRSLFLFYLWTIAIGG